MCTLIIIFNSNNFTKCRVHFKLNWQTIEYCWFLILYFLWQQTIVMILTNIFSSALLVNNQSRFECIRVHQKVNYRIGRLIRTLSVPLDVWQTTTSLFKGTLQTLDRDSCTLGHSLLSNASIGCTTVELAIQKIQNEVVNILFAIECRKSNTNEMFQPSGRNWEKHFI